MTRRELFSSLIAPVLAPLLPAEPDRQCIDWVIATIDYEAKAVTFRGTVITANWIEECAQFDEKSYATLFNLRLPERYCITEPTPARGVDAYVGTDSKA